MDRTQEALNNSEHIFNCAQSVFAALAEDLGLPRETALRISACFGGGMRCGQTCGAVTGALMAIGMKYGSIKEDDMEGKRAAYEKSLPFIRAFQQRHGTLLCRELLGFDPANPEEAEKIAQLGLHDKVCVKLIAECVKDAEAILFPEQG